MVPRYAASVNSRVSKEGRSSGSHSSVVGKKKSSQLFRRQLVGAPLKRRFLMRAGFCARKLWAAAVGSLVVFWVWDAATEDTFSYSRHDFHWAGNIKLPACPTGRSRNICLHLFYFILFLLLFMKFLQGLDNLVKHWGILLNYNILMVLIKKKKALSRVREKEMWLIKWWNVIIKILIYRKQEIIYHARSLLMQQSHLGAEGANDYHIKQVLPTNSCTIKGAVCKIQLVRLQGKQILLN